MRLDPSKESVETNLDGADDQMRGFLQKVASNVPFGNILNHRVWWVVESGSNGRWFLWEWLLTLRILLDEREWSAICAGWQRDPINNIYDAQ